MMSAVNPLFLFFLSDEYCLYGQSVVIGLVKLTTLTEAATKYVRMQLLGLFTVQ